MRRVTKWSGFAILGLCVGLLAAGCNMAGSRAEPPEFTAVIRVESVVNGGAIKLNGMLVSFLPGSVTVEVDRTGKVMLPYVISLSTNILSAGDTTLGRVALDPGQGAPQLIYFEANSTRVVGQAFVIARK